MVAPLMRAPLASKVQRLPQVAMFCSKKKGRIEICDEPKHSTKEEDCEEDERPPPDDCEPSKKGKAAGLKGKQVDCHESQEKFAKETAKQEEEEDCESSEKDSDKECSSEEEDAKAPTKECPDEEEEEESCSDDDEKHSKAASEMCECVKSAVAKAVEQKSKDGGKSLSKPESCGPSKGKDAPSPKTSKHVRCCNVEQSKSSSGGSKSAAEKCREQRIAMDRGKLPAQAGGKGSPKETAKFDKGDKKNKPCECIKQALEKCKKGAASPKPKGKQPDKPSTKKPDTNKKTDKSKPGKKDSKQGPTQKGKTPAKKKPDLNKGGPKGSSQCEKKRKPVVKCR